MSQTVTIKVIDNDTHNPDVQFKVQLQNPKGPSSIGLRMPQAVVTILDDDDPGCLSFAKVACTLHTANSARCAFHCNAKTTVNF